MSKVMKRSISTMILAPFQGLFVFSLHHFTHVYSICQENISHQAFECKAAYEEALRSHRDIFLASRIYTQYNGAAT